MEPILYLIIPCYNEEQVLPITSGMFLKELKKLIAKDKISGASRILFVDDGSKDDTWNIITELAKQNKYIKGIRQSRNRGHQNAVLAGLMEAMEACDITITIDCDGQDDIRVMEQMVDEYRAGAEVVYGVRSSRQKDSFFKRTTAEGFYRFMNLLGTEIVVNHADYRLISSKVLKAFAEFKEVNLFLRGLIPLVGFHSTSVYYVREERMAGKSHYPLRKMLSLALDGITSLSIKPLRLIMLLGVIVSMISFIGAIWAVVVQLRGASVAGWASMTCIICFLGGVQLMCMGVLGEYVGKIYLEVKHRPRYIISERTEETKQQP